jgi:hypothetical protein
MGTGFQLGRRLSTLQNSNAITKLLPRSRQPHQHVIDSFSSLWKPIFILHAAPCRNLFAIIPLLAPNAHYLHVVYPPLFPRCIIAAKQISFFSKTAPTCRCFLLMNTSSLLESLSLTCPLVHSRGSQSSKFSVCMYIHTYSHWQKSPTSRLAPAKCEKCERSRTSIKLLDRCRNSTIRYSESGLLVLCMAPFYL